MYLLSDIRVQAASADLTRNEAVLLAQISFWEGQALRVIGAFAFCDLLVDWAQGPALHAGNLVRNLPRFLASYLLLIHMQLREHRIGEV